MTYINSQNPLLNRSVSRIFRIRDFLQMFHQKKIVPVAVVNDSKYNEVFSANTERTTSGTTALLTSAAAPKATYITAITLTLAEWGQSAG